jgi:hypothetical protein
MILILAPTPKLFVIVRLKLYDVDWDTVVDCGAIATELKKFALTVKAKLCVA